MLALWRASSLNRYEDVFGTTLIRLDDRMDARPHLFVLFCFAHVLTYAEVCWGMLRYADVCWRMLTYACASSLCTLHNLPRHSHRGLTSSHCFTFIITSPERIYWCNSLNHLTTFFHRLVFHVMQCALQNHLLLDYLHHDITPTRFIVASPATHLLAIPPFYYLSTVHQVNQWKLQHFLVDSIFVRDYVLSWYMCLCMYTHVCNAWRATFRTKTLPKLSFCHSGGQRFCF